MTATPFESLYDRAVTELLDGPVEERRIETAVGETHLLLAGDPDAKPLLVLQGGNVTTPVTLAWVEALADEYRLLAPDTPGQPGKTTTRTADYGRWLVALLDGLGVEAVPAVGLSHGAGVLLEALVRAPDRFESVSLVVPAGFGVGPPAGLARVGVPSLAYRSLPRRWLLDRALGSLATEPPGSLPPVVRDTIAAALRTADLMTGFPGPTRDALRTVGVPVFGVVAADDPFFPARTIGPRIRTTFPECREVLTLPDERHFLGPAGRSQLCHALRGFLESEATG